MLFPAYFVFKPLKGISITREFGNTQKEQIPQFSRKAIEKHLALIKGKESISYSMKGRPLTEKTMLGLYIGHPVEGVIEVPLYNRSFIMNGKDAMALPLDCGNSLLDGCVRMIKEMGMLGAHVTMPLKSTIGRKLDSIDDDARRLGSVNAVVNRDGTLIGYNTEYMAMKDILQRYIQTKEGRVLVLGTGGAGRAAAAASNDLGLKTVLCGRNHDRTVAIARNIGRNVGAVKVESIPRLKGKIDLLMNATPEGMKDLQAENEQSLKVADIARSIESPFGLDLVYSPPWTPFLSAIESRGGIPINGFEVMIAQVIRTQFLWTGETVSHEELQRCAAEAHPEMVG